MFFSDSLQLGGWKGQIVEKTVALEVVQNWLLEHHPASKHLVSNQLHGCGNIVPNKEKHFLKIFLIG